jgi:hypothetical protein
MYNNRYITGIFVLRMNQAKEFDHNITTTSDAKGYHVIKRDTTITRARTI